MTHTRHAIHADSGPRNLVNLPKGALQFRLIAVQLIGVRLQSNLSPSQSLWHLPCAFFRGRVIVEFPVEWAAKTSLKYYRQ